jgi:uncharacterized protein
MMRRLTAVLIGLLFGVGILISGMGNPAKILNFFDVAGAWDPSLAFVMAGAVGVTSIGYRLAFQRGAPLFADAFNLPSSQLIDARLIGGSALFGLGWGLSGFCPGGAVPMLASGNAGPTVFVTGLLVGLIVARHFVVRAARRATESAPRRA